MSGLPPVLRLTDTDTSALLAGAKWRATKTGFEPIQPTVERARLLTKARVSSNVAADIFAVNVLDEALVDQSIGDLSGSPGAARVIEDVPGQIVVETTRRSRQLLALTERFDAGWRVADDILKPTRGRSSTIERRPSACVWRFSRLRRWSRHTPGDVPFQSCELPARLMGDCLWSLVVLCLVPFAFSLGRPKGRILPAG